MPKKKRFRSRYSVQKAVLKVAVAAVALPVLDPNAPKLRPRRGYGTRAAATLDADGAVVDEAPTEGELETVKEFVGLLEMHPNGYGFSPQSRKQLLSRANRSIRARHND